MKSLTQYLYESSSSNITLSELKAIWNVTTKVAFQIPNDYSDDDFTQYISDLLLEDMPTGDDYAKKFFGVNSDNLIDTTFQYTKSNDQENIPNDRNIKLIEFDNSKDDNFSGNNEDLRWRIIDDLQLVAMFDNFVVNNTSSENLKQDLYQIFKVTNSSSINKYPIDLEIKDDGLEFDNP